MGLSRNDLDSLHYKQIFPPLRFGGFGYRSSRQIVHESYVARFASAAYGNRYNVSTMAPFLLQDLLSPETSPLPSLQAVSASWEIICKREPRITALSKAATMGVLCPPIQNPDDTVSTTWERLLQAQESLCQNRFKSQVVLGIITDNPSTSWKQATQEITDRAAAAYLENTTLAN